MTSFTRMDHHRRCRQTRSTEALTTALHPVLFWARMHASVTGRSLSAHTRWSHVVRGRPQSRVRFTIVPSLVAQNIPRTVVGNKYEYETSKPCKEVEVVIHWQQQNCTQWLQSLHIYTLQPTALTETEMTTNKVSGNTTLMHASTPTCLKYVVLQTRQLTKLSEAERCFGNK